LVGAGLAGDCPPGGAGPGRRGFGLASLRLGHQMFLPHVLQATLKPPLLLRTWFGCPHVATHTIGGNVETGTSDLVHLGACLDSKR
jgi:hypothetical protein